MFCRLTSQHRTLHEMCPGNTKTEMGRNTVWKMQYCERTNWGRVKRQTGGGAKSALALNWIDLERFWQCKSLNWHLPESKKVCKYGATMHIEGSRSLWRKNYPSGGVRSSNWLSSQLENLTRLGGTMAHYCITACSEVYSLASNLQALLEFSHSLSLFIYQCFSSIGKF